MCVCNRIAECWRGTVDAASMLQMRAHTRLLAGFNTHDSSSLLAHTYLHLVYARCRVCAARVRADSREHVTTTSTATTTTTTLRLRCCLSSREIYIYLKSIHVYFSSSSSSSLGWLVLSVFVPQVMQAARDFSLLRCHAVRPPPQLHPTPASSCHKDHRCCCCGALFYAPLSAALAEHRGCVLQRKPRGPVGWCCGFVYTHRAPPTRRQTKTKQPQLPTPPKTTRTLFNGKKPTRSAPPHNIHARGEDVH